MNWFKNKKKQITLIKQKYQSNELKTTTIQLFKEALKRPWAASGLKE